MRSINPETDKPWPKKRPVNWSFVRRVLKWRQADKRIRGEGFEKVEAFSSLPWESPYHTHRILEARIHPDGQTLYVKTERIIRG